MWSNVSYEGSTNAKCPCRTQWLAAGRNASFLGASGVDHKQAWPEAAVEHLKTLIEASKDDASRKVTAQRVCERETLLEHFAIVPVAAHPEKRRARLQDRVHGAEMADRADSQEDRVARDTSRKRGLLCP